MRTAILLLILGGMFIGAGIVLAIFEFSFFSYANYLPEHNYTEKREQLYYPIDKQDLYIKIANNNYLIVEDNTLTNQARVTFTYYPTFIKLSKVETETIRYRQLKVKYNFSHSEEDFYYELFNLISDDIKNRTIHNYSAFFRPYIEVSVNRSELNKVKIIR